MIDPMPPDAHAAGGARGLWRWKTVALAAAAAAALTAWLTLENRRDGTAAGAATAGRVTRLTTEPGLELDPALSPDGQTLAYSAGPPGRSRILLRQLATGQTRHLTDGGLAGGERWPQWSADGSQIVFQAGSPQLEQDTTRGTARLYVVPAHGGVARPVFESTAPPFAFAPAWFPNKKDVVFSGGNGIFAVDVAGNGTPRRLVPGSDVHSPRWSPDGRWLAYVEHGAQFTFGEHLFGTVTDSRLVIHPDGSAATIAVTDGNALATNPVWLPDSLTLLFIGSRGGARDIYRLRVSPQGISTDEAPQRFASGTNAHTMSLSADGRLLVYASYTQGTDIWSIPIPQSGAASAAGATQVTFGRERIEKLAISPDGRWLAFDSDREGQADVWKVPTAGGPAERITRSAENEFVNDWSPDGRELVIHAIRNGQRDLLVIPADGARSEPVATTPVHEQHAGWGPDGNSIVFDAPPKPGERDQAFVVTRAKPGAPWGPPRQLTRNGSADPKWSPDGRLIAFSADYELRVVSRDGSGERVVVSGRKGTDLLEPSYPVWSRDSRTIYYRTYDPAGRSAIWSVGLDGPAPRQLVRFDDPARRSLRREFATDGNVVFFTVIRDEADVYGMEISRNR
jgi:Tol biopolymer transport system component